MLLQVICCYYREFHLLSRIFFLLLQAPHLVDEGSKLVEDLDLLLLLGIHSLDVGVNLHLQGSQQALVHLDSCNASQPAITLSQIHIVAQASLVATAHLGKDQEADAGSIC